jgi:hypothetical protein
MLPSLSRTIERTYSSVLTVLVVATSKLAKPEVPNVESVVPSFNKRVTE